MTNLIKFDLMEAKGCLIDGDFVRPPSNKTERSSSLFATICSSTKLLSEWLLPKDTNEERKYIVEFEIQFLEMKVISVN